MNGRVEQVRHQIESAFSHVPYPGDDRIAYAPDAWECSKLTADFRGRPWKNVPVEVLRTHAAQLSLFSTAAFPYYLPAYLLAAFDDLDVRDFLLSELELPSPAEADLHASFLAKFEPLSTRQKSAIAAFLRWMRDDAPGELSRQHWTQALERYWERDWQ